MAIIHVDMDAFFASVEQRDKPELRGKPVAVGNRPEQRGVVAATSYEARKFGVKSAMPMATAVRLCPDLIILPVDYPKYREVSQFIMEIFHSYTPLVEPLSLDEAFLDVKGVEDLYGPAETIGANIKGRIENELQLPASAGIGPNKFIAKLASDYQKPGGFTIVPAEKVQDFLQPMPVEKIWGIGEKNFDKLKHMGIKTIGQLQELDLETLQKTFGKYGRELFDFARGHDTRKVEPRREVKSIGKETTFAEDVYDIEELQQTLLELSEKVSRRLRLNNIKCGSVTLKIKYPGQQVITRTETLPDLTDLTTPIYKTACSLLKQHCRPPVRLIGITSGKLTREHSQPLFKNEDCVKEEKITTALDKLQNRYGEDIIKHAALLKKNSHGDGPRG